MKESIFSILLVLFSVDVLANEHKSVQLSGAKLYQKHCALCHGTKAQKSPLLNIPPLAGRNATILARITRTYRDQDERHGTAHTANRESQIMQEATSSLSDQHISAITTYISGL